MGLRQVGDADRAAVIASLRKQMGALAPAPDLGAKGRALGPESRSGGVISTPEPLAAAIPAGGLPRRAVTQASACAALVVELVAHATASGARVGVVGWPELSFAAVAASGGDLERVIAAPQPGPDALGIAAILCEGLDLVVCHAPSPVRLTPTQMRPVAGKLRVGQAALLCVGVEVPSPALRLGARVTQVHGLGRGTGRIRGVDIAVDVQVKGVPAGAVTLRVGTAGQASAGQVSAEQASTGQASATQSPAGQESSARRLRAV